MHWICSVRISHTSIILVQNTIASQETVSRIPSGEQANLFNGPATLFVEKDVPDGLVRTHTPRRVQLEQPLANHGMTHYP
jgi:hypothetical protein